MDSPFTGVGAVAGLAGVGTVMAVVSVSFPPRKSTVLVDRLYGVDEITSNDSLNR